MNTTELSELLPKVIDIAKKAGTFIRTERLNFKYENAEIKGLNDMVSYVDKGAEALIIEDLFKILPTAGFIAEEDTRSEQKEFNWIIDPLDGTTNFIHGIPCYAVSIALECKNEIYLGVVYEVTRDECFYATKGGGAFLNGKSIEVSARKNLSESLIATGFPVSDLRRMDGYLEALKHFVGHTHGVRRIGAASADLCYLACGRFDAFFEYNLKPWDVAAGGLIIKEAGGMIVDFSGKDNWIFGKETSATNKHLEKEFNKIIQTSFNTGLIFPEN